MCCLPSDNLLLLGCVEQSMWAKPLNIPLCGRALRSVAHGQSKRSANVPLTLTGKPNPAQITLWHNISLVGLIVFFPVYNEIRNGYVSGWRSACTFSNSFYSFKFIKLKTLNVKNMSCFWSHLANLPKKFNNWKSRVYLIFIRPTLFPWKHSFSYCATEHSKHAHKMK